MHRYAVVIYWSSDDRRYIAEVPELPGCMAHGDTQHEALESINEAMTYWIETARELGRPVPEPRGERPMLA